MYEKSQKQHLTEVAGAAHLPQLHHDSELVHEVTVGQAVAKVWRNEVDDKSIYHVTVHDRRNEHELFREQERLDSVLLEDALKALQDGNFWACRQVYSK